MLAAATEELNNCDERRDDPPGTSMTMMWLTQYETWSTFGLDAQRAFPALSSLKIKDGV